MHGMCIACNYLIFYINRKLNCAAELWQHFCVAKINVLFYSSNDTL